MLPKFSVIIPAYNAEHFIERAIKSALAQTEERIEVLVVDDGSTDKTADRVLEIMDSRVRFLPGDSNHGPSHARNRALSQARGEWIAFLDADDWYAPERLEKLLQIATKQKVELVADDMYRIVPRQQGKRQQTKMERYNLKNLVIVDAVSFLRFNCGMQPIIQRNLLNKNGIVFDERFQHGEDILFILECLLAGGRLAICPEAMYYYTWQPNSLTTRKVEGLEQWLHIIHQLLGRDNLSHEPLLRGALESQLARAKESLCFYRVMEPLKQGNFVEAFRSGFFQPIFFLTLCKSIPNFLKNFSWIRV